ncbi:hypothetical protein VTO73DRAFT_12444 [Trametes versicolor]
MSSTTIIPGRAMMLDVKWSEKRRLRILNVYGPNDPSENAAFWDRIRETRMPRLDIMTGDFNVVEDGLDRIPVRADAPRAANALANLVSWLNMLDGWRTENPQTKGFTFMQPSTGSQSRLDRIYIRKAMSNDANGWTLAEPGIPTDHKMALVALTDYKAPYIGKGRWSMPVHLLNDEQMKKEMKRLGAELVRDLGALVERSQSNNPQTIYQRFKEQLTLAARNRAKEKIPKMQKRLDALKRDLHMLLNPERDAEGGAGETTASSQETTRSAAILQDRIAKLEIKRFGWTRRDTAVKHWAHSETISKQWIRANTNRLTSEVMFEMKEQDGQEEQYTTRSSRMAQIACEFYDKLQDEEPLQRNETHGTYVQEALQHLSARLDNEQKASLAKRMSREDVSEAIRSAARNKSPGLDGLPAEVWKEYARWYDADTKRGTLAVDMTAALCAVFNDIEKHGVDPTVSFTDGWICPIYKLKKDKREINNYRPITLLNSDYKLMTKVIAAKIADHVPSIVHPDQAGFIPGRRIVDQIKLSKLMLDYAEAEEVNGAIVALDQEKAYDKINHDYLWAVLRRFNFPENLINTVKRLYERAESCVFVNGVKSVKFKIRRGSRSLQPSEHLR